MDENPYKSPEAEAPLRQPANWKAIAAVVALVLFLAALLLPAKFSTGRSRPAGDVTRTNAP